MTVRDARPEEAEELREIVRRGQEHYKQNMDAYPDAVSLEETVRRRHDMFAMPKPSLTVWQRLMFWRSWN